MKKKIKRAEWDRAAEWWNAEAGDRGVWHQQNDIDPVIFQILGSIKNKKILEIGCGNGYFSRNLAGKGAMVTAVDISKKFIAIAKKKEKLNPLGIKYFIGDAAHLLGFKNQSFDIVVANMCLMDITDAEKALKEIGRVIKVGGRLVFSITHPVFCDFYQQWIIIKHNNKKYFARAIAKYFTTCSKKKVLWASGIKTTYFHRPFSVYFEYLKWSGFYISDLREIITKKRPIRATLEDGDVSLRRSRYKTAAERKMKELARKEIPMFLVVEAIKK